MRRLLVLVSFALAAVSHAQAPALLEGKITGLDLPNRILTVMDVQVHVPLRAQITSPTAALSLEDLGGAPLPGRSAGGFLFGTAVVNGTVVDGVFEADLIQVQPNENVLGGPVVWVNSKPRVFGKKIVVLTDSRMPGRAINDANLPVFFNTAAEGADVTASGYWGDDGIFYAYELLCDTAQVVKTPAATTVTIARWQSGRLSVRGGSTNRTGFVKIYDADTGLLLGQVDVTDTGYYGAYAADLRGLSTMPRRVRVLHKNGTMASLDVKF